jgi:hypothetical protein
VLFSTEVAAMVTENFRKKSWGGVVESFKANAKNNRTNSLEALSQLQLVCSLRTK